MATEHSGLPGVARALGTPFLRFLFAGVLNTLLSYVVYLALLRVLPYGWSYTLSYLAGIGLAYVLQRYVVFQRSGGRAALLWVTLIYVLQYLLGMASVWFWVSVLAWPAELALLLAVGLTVPVTYLLNRRVFRSASDGVPRA